MSPKSSVPQAARFVSQVLMPDTGQVLAEIAARFERNIRLVIVFERVVLAEIAARFERN